MNKKYLLASLTLHVLTLFILAGQAKLASKAEEQSGGRKSFNVQIIAKEDSEKTPVVDKQKDAPTVKIPKKKIDPKCPHWYGGIGILLGATNVVEYVYPGYPAAQAGLQTGDLIMYIEGGEVTGDPGTVTKFTVTRDGNIIPFSIIRGKICF